MEVEVEVEMGVVDVEGQGSSNVRGDAGRCEGTLIISSNST